MASAGESLVSIPAGKVTLEGMLTVPQTARGIVVFAHGSGSSRKSPRNNFVADVIRKQDVATLLFDLLTEEEDRDRQRRFDIELLTDRLRRVTEWVNRYGETDHLTVGYFGSSTGAAAALRAAANDDTIATVVSRGGRVDMAKEALSEVRAATLFIVGGNDTEVLALNRSAYERLETEKELHIVDGAGHLFEGPGELDEVADVAAHWFRETLS